jgi:hypothetical protein
MYDTRVRSRLALVGLVAACGIHITDGAHDTQIDASPDSTTQIDAAIDAPAATCNGSGQAQSGNSCFTLFTSPLTFGSAASACLATSEHLAIISSAADNAAISTLIGSNLIAYVGGTEQANPGTWLWTNGAQFWNGIVGGSAVGGLYTNFGTGEPNNGGGKFLEYCLTIRGDRSDTWDDRPCGPETGAGGSGQDAVVYAYVCERP